MNDLYTEAIEAIIVVQQGENRTLVHMLFSIQGYVEWHISRPLVKTFAECH